jgi:rSAM/selenodomain-associated transferase 1
MAKLPTAGRVKTRLCPPLTPEAAAALHGTFLTMTLDLLRRSEAIGRVVLCWTGEGEPTKHAADEYREQGTGNLGDRLAHVAAELPDNPLLFFGADTPHLPVAHLAAAAKLLNDGRVVLGPCDDGGFWTMGVPDPAATADLVRGVPWSSGRELDAVRASANRHGTPAADAPAWWDVDRPDDLARLHQAGPAFADAVDAAHAASADSA